MEPTYSLLSIFTAMWFAGKIVKWWRVETAKEGMLAIEEKFFGTDDFFSETYLFVSVIVVHRWKYYYISEVGNNGVYRRFNLV